MFNEPVENIIQLFNAYSDDVERKKNRKWIQLVEKQKSRTHIKDTDQSNSMVCSTLASRYETLFLKNKYRII